MLLAIKIIALLGIAQLWRLGGAGYKYCRRIIVPLLLGAYIGWQYGLGIGLISVGSFQIVGIGYGAYDPEHDPKPSFLARITKDRQGWIIRGIAGFLYGFVGLLPLVIYSWIHKLDLDWQVWIGYALINAFIGAVFCALKVKDEVIERLIGMGVALMLFMF